MTTEAALLDAIYEHPDDDAPRWVYTDHLLERGDPRGELMALQLRRDALTDAEVRTARMLVGIHATRWVPEELQRRTVRRSWLFERGFLARCSLRESEQAVGPQPIDHPAWRTLHTIVAPGVQLGANKLLLTPALAGLQRLELTTGTFLPLYLRDPQPKALATLAVSQGKGTTTSSELVELLTASPALPRLRHLFVNWLSTGDLCALLESELAARIERLSMDSDYGWRDVPEALRGRVHSVAFGYGLRREVFAW